jgi:glycosyltransferase involved in cell wall biosynthesis
MMKLSIAQCTYNGARYLREQLDSFSAQGRLPDELVVCDDGSTDGTLAILDDFARSAPFPVMIIRNEMNLGVAKNFEQAIHLCGGDVIVLSDQDDVWYPGKLEKMHKAFSDYPNVGLTFSDAEVVDESLCSCGYRLWQQVGVTKSVRGLFRANRGIEVLIRQPAVTGATMAFRAKFKSFLHPMPPYWMHDRWIALMVTAVSDVHFIEEPLIAYRQHSDNQIGARRKTFTYRWQQLFHSKRSNYQFELIRFEGAAERFETSAGEQRSKFVSRLFSAKVRHQRTRAELPASIWTRIPYVGAGLLCGHYHRFARSFASAAMDLFMED